MSSTGEHHAPLQHHHAIPTPRQGLYLRANYIKSCLQGSSTYEPWDISSALCMPINRLSLSDHRKETTFKVLLGEAGYVPCQ